MPPSICLYTCGVQALETALAGDVGPGQAAVMEAAMAGLARVGGGGGGGRGGGGAERRRSPAHRKKPPHVLVGSQPSGGDGGGGQLSVAAGVSPQLQSAVRVPPQNVQKAA